MTEQVRRNYRNHRKATWGFVIALMIAIAAVVIPIASGAADKTYTMLFPSTGPSRRRRPVSGSTTSQTLCSGSAYTVKVAITNTAKSSQLGSADVTFPANVTLSSATSSGRAWQLEERKRRLASAALASEERRGHDYRRSRHRGRRNARAGDHRSGQAVERLQRLRLEPNANTFDNPTFPTISVQACTATITGRVYHDRDQSGAFAVNPSSPTSDIAKQGWKVTLQRQTGASNYYQRRHRLVGRERHVLGRRPDRKQLPAVRHSPNAADSSSSWGVRAVSGVTLVDGCAPMRTSDAPKGLSVTNLPSAGKTGQDFAVVPITTPNFGPGNTATDGDYVVTAAGTGGKDPAALRAGDMDRQRPPVLRLRADQRLHGLRWQDLPAGAAVRLDPAERSRADPPGRARLRRHRALPDVCADAVLPPGSSGAGSSLLTAGVLPPSPPPPADPTTSCIVEGHQRVDGNGTVANAKVDFEFFVYTSYDGLRGAT